MSFYSNIAVTQSIQLSDCIMVLEPIDLPPSDCAFYGIPEDYDGIVWSVHTTALDDQDGETLDGVGVFTTENLMDAVYCFSEEDQEEFHYQLFN